MKEVSWPAMRELSRFLTAATDGLVTPGPRMVDELECVASVLLAVALGHLADARNISWAAFSGYMVMRGHVLESCIRGAMRIAGTISGGLLALLVAPFVTNSMAASAAALGAIGGGSLYCTLTRKRSYAWLFFGLTFAMVVLDKLEQRQDSLGAFMSTRVRESVAGTSACIIVSLLSTLTVRRRWPSQRRPLSDSVGWHSDAARHSIQAAFALCILPLLAHAFHISELSQAAVTIMAVMIIPLRSVRESGLSPVTRRIVLRLAGCCSGAAIAAGFLFFAHASASGTVAILLAGTVVGIVIGRHIENGPTPIAYAGTQFTLAILVTLVPDSYAQAEIDPALARLSGVLAGIAVLVPVLVLSNAGARFTKVRSLSGPVEPGDI